MKRKLSVVCFCILMLIQIVGYVLGLDKLYIGSGFVLYLLVLIGYLRNTQKTEVYQIVVILLFMIGNAHSFWENVYSLQAKLVFQIGFYSLLFRFLYQNHKSFHYNRRDVFTLVLGSLLFTVIFVIVFFTLKAPLLELWYLGFLNLFLLYLLLIITAMHYINIRSSKSLWFFLAILYFTFTDFIFLFDLFYLSSMELQVISLFCKPLGFVFLVGYMVTKYQNLRAEEFEGF